MRSQMEPVQILYEGKTNKTAIDDKSTFDQNKDALAIDHVSEQLPRRNGISRLSKALPRDGQTFDDLLQERTAEEVAKLKKKWGTTEDLLESKSESKLSQQTWSIIT